MTSLIKVAIKISLAMKLVAPIIQGVASRQSYYSAKKVWIIYIYIFAHIHYPLLHKTYVIKSLLFLLFR